MSIIVLGTVALDTVKTPCGARTQMLGGSAVHFSMSCRLFCDVNLVAIIGNDFPGRHIEFLRQKGLNLSSLIRTEGKTFQWAGEYKAGDLNTAVTLSTELGVLTSFRPTISEKQRNIKNIFLANIDPELQDYLLTHMRKRRLVALDSMNYWIHNKRAPLLRLLKKVDIYVANDQEARDLSQESNLVKAAKRLRSLGPRMVLIKKGEHGVLFSTGNSIFSLPAYPVEKVVDPTGAGDTFAGAFMGYLASTPKIKPESIKRALAYGTVAASFNIEGFGPEKTASLKRTDLDKRLRSFMRCFSF